MNTLSKMKTRLALFSLAGSLLLSNFAAAAVPSHLNEDYVLILSVPFEAPDEITIRYTNGGGDGERTVALSEKVTITISALDLDLENIPFDLSRTSDGFALDLGTHPENALSPILGILSDLSTIGLGQESTVQFSSTIPGSTLGIYPVSDKENAEFTIEGEDPVPFVQEGVLRMEFKKQAELVENPEEVAPEAESSGGCSLQAGAVSGSLAWLLLLPLATAAVFRKRIAVKP